MSEPVLLLHGLWLRAFTLRPLARRLAAAGFAPHFLDYASIRGGAEQAVPAVAARLRALGPGPVHLVAHSLGGLVALETLQTHSDLPPGRVVCLGSPLRGSAAARGLRRWPGGRYLLGYSADFLSRGLARVPDGRDVGVLAGDVPIGLGWWPGRFARPHDGTVALAETRLPGLADHRVVHTTHTGLIFSAQAAGLVIAFLRNRRFPEEWGPGKRP